MTAEYGATGRLGQLVFERYVTVSSAEPTVPKQGHVGRPMRSPRLLNREKMTSEIPVLHRVVILRPLNAWTLRHRHPLVIAAAAGTRQHSWSVPNFVNNQAQILHDPDFAARMVGTLGHTGRSASG